MERFTRKAIEASLNRDCADSAGLLTPLDGGGVLMKNANSTQLRGLLHRLTLLVAALTIGLGPFTPASGQVTTATLVIVVEDQAGAIVPGASVTVTNEATGSSRTFTSDDTGLITAGSLQPGTYTLVAEMAGFKKSVQSGMVLTVNQRARQTIVLQVGEVTESVTVI